MLQGIRGIVGRNYVPPHAAIAGLRFMATNPTRFTADQNKDRFTLGGLDVPPSSLRPNLDAPPSTTSDENWAQILRDVDPPNQSILHAGRPAMRSSTSAPPPLRRHHATASELQAMDQVFKQVFSMDTPSHGQLEKSLFASSPSAFASFRARRSFGLSKDPEMMFDIKREEIRLCKTDQELLRWTMAEVFQEPSPQTSPDATGASETAASDASHSTESTQPTQPIHPAIYARVIAHLMVEFRERYQNPHLAIAIFDHAKRRSIVSYVTGCTAPSYNELMRSYWSSFRDLQTVFNIAEEMRVNGVKPDDRTHLLFLQIREEASQQAAWFEGGEEELGKTLSELEGLMKPSYRPRNLLA